MRRVAVLVLLLAGCGSSNPTLYTLSSRLGPTQPGPRQIVAMRDVSIPRYLERQGIVRRDGDRLVVAENDWWAEPLSAMVRRVFAADLAQRLPSSDVLASDGLGGGRPDIEIELDLQRFEADGSVIVLEGTAVIRRDGTRELPRLTTQVPIAAPDIRGQVVSMSDALGRSADMLAARIARFREGNVGINNDPMIALGSMATGP